VAAADTARGRIERDLMTAPSSGWSPSPCSCARCRRRRRSWPAS
jgi:hypothetical protein